jgi:hypothetical protein
MIYEPFRDLIDRKNKLCMTNREIANLIGCSPSVASSKLNGFCVLTANEHSKIDKELTKLEKVKKELCDRCVPGQDTCRHCLKKHFTI